MVESKRAQKSRQVFLDRSLVLHLLLSGVASSVKHMSDYQRAVVARTIGNAIYDLPCVWSGWQSQGLLDAKAVNPKQKKCQEHYIPRQVAGAQIVSHMLRYGGISLSFLRTRLDIYRQVHWTTSEENMRLVAFQKVGVFVDSHTAYAQAGITLIKL